MNQINRQVNRARKRILTGSFFRILTWAAFGSLLVAVVGIAIPKVWHFEFLSLQSQNNAWVYSWVLGGAGCAVALACCLTWLNRKSPLDAAVELDNRFGLKERLSSAMALAPDAAQSEAGRALIADAEYRAESLDVRDQFRYHPSWRSLLPLVPILLLAFLIFIPNASKKAAANEVDAIDKKRVEVVIKEIQKKIETKRKEAVAKGLKDADPELKAFAKEFDKLLDDPSDSKKETLVKLNNIKKQIEDRRKALGSSKELRASFAKLKDVGKGPAKKLADAMSQGDMEKAKSAIKELADKLKSGKLDQGELKKLAADLKQMADALKDLAEKHEREKKNLEDQINNALDRGDLDKAAQLQQKLDEKKNLDNQQQKLKKMAEQLQKCAECMNPGANGQSQPGQDGEQSAGQTSEQAQAMKEAGESLEDLANQIEEMQQQLDELENLEDLEAMADECKQAMNGGQGGKHDDPSWADWGKGEGPGGGKRGLEKENTGTFRSRVKAKLQRGQTVVTGHADGKNITGRSVQETRQLVRDSMSKDSDPLENQKLSRTQREHAQQYFKALREK